MFDPSSLPVLSSYDSVQETLTNRVPQKYRDTFFQPTPSQDLTPQEMEIDPRALQASASRIKQAIAQKERVLIYGDYDCDGITSTAVLWETLHSLGLDATPFLPRRDVHGYGLSVSALETLWQAGSFDLVITVDNGILAHKAVQWIKDQGADVIVTDHHTPADTLPAADVILHSTLMSGVGVSWALSQALDPDGAKQRLDLVVLGTLADQVKLWGANRSFVVHGLEVLRRTSRPSLGLLAQFAKVDLASISASSLSYSLIPRINAMGRLGDPMDALRALLSRNRQRMEVLISKLEETNTERQNLTQDLFLEVESVVKSQGLDQQSFIVVTGEYHEGVIGLLASRLVDLYARPAIVITTTVTPWKASGRSLPGVHLLDALRSATTVQFASLGGHELAAGFSLNPDDSVTQIDLLRSHLYENYPNIQVKSNTEIIGTLDIRLLNAELWSVLLRFAPFGSGNPEPEFLLQDVSFEQVKPVGSTGQHWRGVIVSQNSDTRIPAIFFKATQKFPGEPKDITSMSVRLSASTYKNKQFEVHVTKAW